MRIFYLFFIFAFVIYSSPVLSNQPTMEGSGLLTGVALDLIGSSEFDGIDPTMEGVIVRSAEILFKAPADHLFDGTLILAAHPEDGEQLFEVHEAFIGSSRLLPRLRFRIGQFFPEIGRLNGFHQHDRPFILTPLIHKEILGDEGVIDTGLESATLLPLPFYAELSAGLVNGRAFGHTDLLNPWPKIPTHYLRLLGYNQLNEVGWLYGATYLGRADSAGLRMDLIGLQLSGKRRTGRVATFLSESEVWLRSLQQNGGKSDETLGVYWYPQIGFSNGLSIGVLFELITSLGIKNSVGERIVDYTIAAAPSVSWAPSEFVVLRVQYRQQSHYLNGHTFDGELALQSVFTIGIHPAHDY